MDKLKTEKEKVDAVKCQIQFRQKVLLEKNITDANLFNFSHKKEVFTLSRLKENLLSIIASVHKVTQDHSVPALPTIPLSVSVEKLEREKERLKLLLRKEDEKLISNDQEPIPKKARSENQNTSKKLPKAPKVTNKDRSNAHCINSLVGKGSSPNYG